jgi:hypothetical protein
MDALGGFLVMMQPVERWGHTGLFAVHTLELLAIVLLLV